MWHSNEVMLPHRFRMCASLERFLALRVKAEDLIPAILDTVKHATKKRRRKKATRKKKKKKKKKSNTQKKERKKSNTQKKKKKKKSNTQKKPSNTQNPTATTTKKKKKKRSGNLGKFSPGWFAGTHHRNMQSTDTGNRLHPQITGALENPSSPRHIAWEHDLLRATS